MSYLKDLYRKDPRRWIPTIAIIIFVPLMTFYSIRDGFINMWLGWIVIILMTVVYIWNVIYEIRKRKKRDRWPEL